ncbi:hypothetical protein D1953_14500 [Peribacillus asahii]|uniref:Uncharacterized protein n=1 Tax=Peribacillus asahii TaxID=228899 RepID=A0A398B3P3_9BACI|nr:hypothetical protein [Peribacillus asahii]RID84054.1 hypothetical protein D1953_14500 [Peribacillus asahii]
MSGQTIVSFIFRFHLVNTEIWTEEKQWRIKVTHIQDDDEMTFENLDDAVNFVRQSLTKR